MNTNIITQEHHVSSTDVSTTTDAYGSDKIDAVVPSESQTFFADSDTSISLGSSASVVTCLPPLPQNITSFLNRPLLLYSFTNGTGLQRFNLFNDYFTNAVVSEKIRNVNMTRFNMHVRIVESANPYIYGLSRYNFLHNVTEQSLSPEQASAAPGVYMDPALLNPVEYVIPNAHYVDYYSSTDSTLTVDNIVMFRTVCVTYRNAETAGNEPGVPISVYVWLSDIEYSFLNPGDESFVFQSEFTGTVSKPLSLVSKAAELMKGVPLLRGFMTPVQRASQFGAETANKLGFSKANLVDSPSTMITYSSRNPFSTVGPSDHQTLTLSPVNQTAITSSPICGRDEDEMHFSYITKRFARVRGFSVPTTANPGDLLITHVITPGNFAKRGPTSDEYHLTPVCHVAAAFKYWRGTLRYNFRVVCSKFHRGRIRIVWIPSVATPVPATAPSNDVHSVVLDLTTSKQICIDVPYAKAGAYKNFALLQNTSATSNIYADSTNGYFAIYVEQRTQSISTSSPEVYITMCAGDDFEVAVPTNLVISQFIIGTQTSAGKNPYSVITGLSALRPPMLDADNYYPKASSNEFAFQSGKDEPFPMDDKVECVKLVPICDNLHTTTFHIGERITSLRSLLKAEQVYSSTEVPGCGITEFVAFSLPLLPRPPTADADNTNVNSLSFLPRLMNYIDWFSPAYLYRRGGIAYRVLNGPSFLARTSVYRIRSNIDVHIDISSIVAFRRQLNSLQNQGFAVTNNGGATAFILPYQHPYKALMCRWDRINEDVVFPGTMDRGLVVIEGGSEYNPSITVSAADDFSLHYYTYPPPVRLLKL